MRLYQIHVSQTADITSNHTNVPGCLELPDIIRTRRNYDMVCAMFGLIFSSLHLGLIVYIRYVQKRKGFFLLFMQAILSIVTLILLIFGCFIDVCIIRVNYTGTFFRAFIWQFSVNAFIAAYGFLIIALCIDRYVALNNPLYYRLTFVRLKMRLMIVTSCLLLGMLCSTKWLPFNQITSTYDFEENEFVTSTAWYVALRTVCTILQYFSSGIAMILLAISNVVRLRKIDQAHFNELRMSELSRNRWTRKQKTSAKICILLAVAFVLFNWPYACTDYVYTDDLGETVWYGTIELIINLLQVIYLQLNLFLFAYCSRSYRRNLLLFLTLSCRNFKKILCCYHGKMTVYKAEEKHRGTEPVVEVLRMENLTKKY